MATSAANIKKLGEGPFQINDVIYGDDYWNGAWGNPYGGVTQEDPHRCAACCKRISNRAIVEDKASGRRHIVGLDCAGRALDIEFSRLRDAEVRAQAAWLNRLFRDTEFTAWAAAQPHPKGWGGRNLLDDTRYWASKRDMKRVRAAVAAWRGGDAEPLLKAERLVAEVRAARAADREARDRAWRKHMDRTETGREIDRAILEDIDSYLGRMGEVPGDAPDRTKLRKEINAWWLGRQQAAATPWRAAFEKRWGEPIGDYSYEASNAAYHAEIAALNAAKEAQ